MLSANSERRGKEAEMRSGVCFRLFLINAMTVPVFLFASTDIATVAGTVRHASVKSHTTIVYIDEMPNLEPAKPAVQPIVEFKRNRFSPAVLPVVAGTTVKFLNNDGRKHTVFSVDGEKYDLGEFKEGESREHTFTDAGTYAQLCSRHPQHAAYVVVLKTPYFAIADDAGRFQISGVPAGAWKLKVWNESLALNQTRQAYTVEVRQGMGDVEIDVPSLPSIEKFWLEPPPPAKAGIVERGAWLYRQKGCFLCHGEQGIGGVPNNNYVKRTIPALDTLAERLLLFDAEDVKLILDELERGRNLEALRDAPPLPRFEAFLAQYASVRDVIRKGNPAGKLHAKGPNPPLDMPRNKDVLPADVDALIAYLVTLQGWDEKRP